MQPPHNQLVPNWVRCFLCVAAALSVPALIAAASLGITITAPLSVVVGVFAFRATTFAFNGGR